MNNFIHPKAHVHETAKVWHYAVIAEDVVVNERVSIGSHAEIGRNSIISADARISKGVFLPACSYIGARVFIGPNVTFTDDRYPRVNNPNYEALPPVVEDDAAIGAGCVILPGVRIGAGALVGAGTVVTRDVPAKTVLRNSLSTVSSTARDSREVVLSEI